MRKPYVIGLLVLFVVVNGLIIFWVWDRFTDPPDPEPETKSEIRRQVSEEYGRTESLASDLIAKWNREGVIPLDSIELDSHIESLPEGDCIGLPSGAIAIDSSTLPADVRQDLNAAVVGLLRAYQESQPDSVINYMKDRGKHLDSRYRQRAQRALIKQGVSEPDKLGDEDQYRAVWTASKTNAHWSGLVDEASCRQFWDGKNVALNSTWFDTNSAPDAPPGQLEQAAYLFRLFRGKGRARHNFVSDAGSFQESHKDDPQFLLCDVQLIIEFDESYSRARAANLLRIWFNPRLKKWQPHDFIRFSSDPNGISLPSIMF